MSETRDDPPSTAATRWFLPILVIWAGLLLSAWVFTKKIPEEIRDDNTKRLAVTLLAVPVLSTLVLVLLRAIGKQKRTTSRAGDMLVVWIMAFMFTVHASVLAVAIGMIDSLDHTVPAATGVLMFGMGVVLLGLEHRSAMGIRTKATLASFEVWHRTHRLAAKLFTAAGIVALSGLLLEGPAVVVIAVLPGTIALVIAIAYASRIEPQAPDASKSPAVEDPRDEDRPTEEDGSP